jgi:hypothetical protein
MQCWKMQINIDLCILYTVYYDVHVVYDSKFCKETFWYIFYLPVYTLAYSIQYIKYKRLL